MTTLRLFAVYLGFWSAAMAATHGQSLQLHDPQFRAYLTSVNQAEESIVNDDFAAASDHYIEAFHSKQQPFATDLFNALLCATHEQRYDVAEAHAHGLARLGCPLEVFANNPNLKGFVNSTYYKPFLNGYDADRMINERNVDHAVRGKVDSLFTIDQTMRLADPEYSFLRDSIYREDMRIMRALLPLLNTDYPSEQRLGVRWGPQAPSWETEPLVIILLHNYNSYDTTGTDNPNGLRTAAEATDVSDQLMKAVEQGSLHPEVFAYLHDRSGAFQKGINFQQEMGILVIEGRCYVGRANVNAALNARRAALGLCTREQLLAKAVYDMRSNAMGFVMSRGMSGNVSILEGLEWTTLPQETRDGLIDLGPYEPPSESEH
ncbi:MAG: hypothetical protein IPN38_01560 [Flavobacteriales bacterium]|nr:hypothetical protein [Flavobacteriales bacterium]